MSEDSQEKTMQEVLTNGLRKLLGRDFILLGLLIIGTTIVLLKGKDALAQQVDAGVAPLKAEQQRLATEQERIKEKQASFELKVDKRFDEQGADIRALYKAMMTGQKQDRLEKPLPSPDGGQ